MVELQFLTGARPGEILDMRAADIDRRGEVWAYCPSSHKNLWRGHDRVIYLGPRSQEIVRGFLGTVPDESNLFSPTRAELRRRDRLRAARKTPLYPPRCQGSCRLVRRAAGPLAGRQAG
jgi:integrase